MRIKTEKDYLEKRKYIRLPSVFPVEYSILDLEGPPKILDWQQAFTCNVSEGGLCLSINKVDGPLLRSLHRGKVRMRLRIRIPLYSPPVEADASLSWMDKIEDEVPSKYLIGVQFTSVSKRDVNRMIKHARWIKFVLPATVGIAFILLGAFGVSFFHNARLRMANQELVQQLVSIQQEETSTGQLIDQVKKEKAEVSRKMGAYGQDIMSYQAQIAQLQEELQARAKSEQLLNEQILEYEKKAGDMRERISDLNSQKDSLDGRFADLARQENALQDEFQMLQRKKEGLQKSISSKMYQWLKNHQIPATGLILSFEGDVGPIQYWGFMYDQALAINAFLLFDDTAAAAKVLNFFRKKMEAPFAGFSNAYYADSGEISEFTVHCGPNIWIGIAALQYQAKTGDKTYLPLAKNVADWLIALQNEDKDGGLRGGPKFTWYATEHNLDAYAFFNMLSEVTGEEKYSVAREKSLSWLMKHAMAPHDQEYQSPPVKRGRGDATIATDTFAWSLAALGPGKIESLGMNPEEIMEFAEKHCRAEVVFRRPSGNTVEVSGFDFAAYQHMPRGGLVSPEWTSQMIVSFQMLSEYFGDNGDMIKAGYYQEKVLKYLNELNKLIISSPSEMGHGEGCLPYSTLEDADTGHGWRTPQGSDTCSIAGTAYMLMAVRGYNPLMLKQRGGK